MCFKETFSVSARYLPFFDKAPSIPTHLFPVQPQPDQRPYVMSNSCSLAPFVTNLSGVARILNLSYMDLMDVHQGNIGPVMFDYLILWPELLTYVHVTMTQALF